MRKLTHEEFLNKFYKKNKHGNDIELMEDYKNNKTKIKCRCKVCEHEWSPTADSLLRGSGCPKCAGNIKSTTEKFINRLQQISPNIIVMGDYVNVDTKIKCKCAIDDYEWEAIPNNLLKGQGCPQCGGTAKLTQKEFEKKFYKKNKYAQDIELLEPYVSAQTKIKCKCKVCEHEWQVTANNLLRGRGCPKCSKKRAAQKQTMTTEEFTTKLYQINPNIVTLEVYTNSVTKIKCKCKKCEHEWSVIPASLLQGSGCPKCNISKGEKRITQYLDNLGINYIYDMPYFKDLVGTGGGLLRPDFIIPSLKIWIEFDGRQHFEPVDFTSKWNEQQLQEQFKIVQQNDQIKNQYAKDNNWTLIRIPFTEYDNIEQILAEYIEQEQVI